MRIHLKNIPLKIDLISASRLEKIIILIKKIFAKNIFFWREVYKADKQSIKTILFHKYIINQYNCLFQFFPFRFNR